MLRVSTLCALLLNVGVAASAASLPRATPESQGVSSAGIASFLERLDRIDSIHSVMVLRHGRVVAEAWWAPYRASDRHMLFSLSKSFTSTAIGLAQAEGKLDVNDPVLPYFPGLAPEDPGDNLRAMRIRDLLRMATGHTGSPFPGLDFRSGSVIRSFLAAPVEAKPGTHFYYNTPATYVAGAIVEAATGEPLLDYLQPRLFDPLGIERPWWETSGEGIATGGFGLNLRTEDIAKFGQLLLQRGRWEGRQLVPAAWVDEATSLQVANGSNPDSEWEQGYGYQFWRCTHGAYRGDGAFGQNCIVIPHKDAVVVTTSGVGDLGEVLAVVWERLLPTLGDEPLADDPAHAEELAGLASRLSLRRPAGAATSAAAGGGRLRVWGDPLGLRGFALEAGDSDDTLTLVNDAGEQRIGIGRGEWAYSRVASVRGLSDIGLTLAEDPRNPGVAVAASGAWVDPSTYRARIVLHETPFHADVELRFAQEKGTPRAEFLATQNVAFTAERTQPTRVGLGAAAR